MNTILNLGVCEARHEMPVEGYIFPSEIPADVITCPQKLYLQAWDKLVDLTADLPTTTDIVSVEYGEDIPVERPAAELHLYATGLTVAVIAAIEAARHMHLPVTVMHYDRTTGNYFPQRIR